MIPVLSIVIPTYNNEKDLARFFKYLTAQSIKKPQCEYIVSDGGSSDRTREIAKRFGATVIHNKERLAEPGVVLGIKNSRADIIMILAVDNFFYDKTDVKKILSVMSDESIAAAFPKHDSVQTDTIWTKYVNTFTDPYSHFVYGESSNARTFHNIYPIIKRTKLYTVFDYASSQEQPLMALAQGFTVKKDALPKKRNSYDDIAPILQIVQSKQNIAYLENVSLYHHSIRSMRHFINKQAWATKNAMSNANFGIKVRSSSLSSSQQFRKKIYPLYAWSFILPLVYGLIKFMSTRERLWLFHPVITLVSAYACTKAVIEVKWSNYSADRTQT